VRGPAGTRRYPLNSCDVDATDDESIHSFSGSAFAPSSTTQINSRRGQLNEAQINNFRRVISKERKEESSQQLKYSAGCKEYLKRHEDERLVKQLQDAKCPIQRANLDDLPPPSFSD